MALYYHWWSSWRNPLLILSFCYPLMNYQMLSNYCCFQPSNYSFDLLLLTVFFYLPDAAARILFAFWRLYWLFLLRLFYFSGDLATRPYFWFLPLVETLFSQSSEDLLAWLFSIFAYLEPLWHLASLSFWISWTDLSHFYHRSWQQVHHFGTFSSPLHFDLSLIPSLQDPCRIFSWYLVSPIISIIWFRSTSICQLIARNCKIQPPGCKDPWDY